MNNLESVYTYEGTTTFTNSSSEKKSQAFPPLCDPMKNNAKYFVAFLLAFVAFTPTIFSQSQPPPAKPAADAKPTSAP